jgi:hypothetical protein
MKGKIYISACEAGAYTYWPDDIRWECIVRSRTEMVTLISDGFLAYNFHLNPILCSNQNYLNKLLFMYRCALFIMLILLMDNDQKLIRIMISWIPYIILQIRRFRDSEISFLNFEILPRWCFSSFVWWLWSHLKAKQQNSKTAKQQNIEIVKE